MKKIVEKIAILCCVIMLAGSVACAAELSVVMNAYTGSDSLVIFVKDQGKEVENVYLGSDEAQAFEVEEVGPVRTVVVLDNSLSIQSKYRDSIKTLLTDLAAARGDGDTFTIATYAKDITYLVQDSNDYLNIKAKVEGLEFTNQESFFTNALYQIIDDICAGEEVMYTRVIVIADGIDNETFGYTDEELNKRIQTAKIPVYTIGCASKGNEENLKRMFALSRLSNAKSYHLDEVSGTDILQDIASDTNVVKISIWPQDKSCDGTSKTVRISYGEDYAVTELNMPFKAAAEESIPQETEPVAEPTAEPTVEPVLEPTAEPTQGTASIVNSFSPVILFVAVGIILIVLIIVVIICVCAKRRKAGRQERSTVDLTDIGVHRSTQPMVWEAEGKSGTSTVLLGEGTSGKNAGNPETEMIGSRGMVRLVLQDVDNPSKTFEYPLRDKVIIGRDAARCQIVIDYNRFISSVHCEILAKDGRLYVRDGGKGMVASTNGTFVNGEKVSPESQLLSGAILQLGQVKFKVTYR